MGTLPIKWKRLIAREFLMILGVAIVCGILAFSLWARTLYIERQVALMDSQMSVLVNSINATQRQLNWPPSKWDGSTPSPDWIPTETAERILEVKKEIDKEWEEGRDKKLSYYLVHAMKLGKERLIDSLIANVISNPPPSVKLARERIPALRMEKDDLYEALTIKRMKLLRTPEVLERTQWTALVMLALLYPLRILYFGVRWSVRVLKGSRTTDTENQETP